MVSSSVMSEKDTSGNLWLTLLSQASTRVLTPESTCVFLGEPNCGKATLIAALAQQRNNHGFISELELINYNYIDVDDSSLATPTKVHLWQLDEKLLPFAKDLLSPEASSERPIMFVIALDMTSGEETIEALKKWLALLRPYVEHLLLAKSEDKREECKNNFLHYLLSARLGKGTASSETVHEELSGKSRYDFAVDNFAFPIVVVGCKMDLVDINNALVLKTLREVQGRIRGICLEAGAALAFTAAEGDAGESSLQHLRKYLLHRLYPKSISLPLNIEEKVQSLFIPSGFDTVDLIHVSTGVKVEKESLQHFISTQASALANKTERKEAKPAPSFAMIESEQDWLAAMQGVISKFSADSSMLKSTNNLLEALQAEAEGAAAPQDKRRPDPIATASSGSGKEASGVPSAPPTKRASIIRSVAATDKKDVGDFFKNLMEGKPKK